MTAKSACMLLSYSVLATVLFAGCNRSKPEQAAADTNQPANAADSSPSPAAPAKDTRPLIVAFGDSLTAGYGAPTDQSYPAYLQRDLNARGYDCRVMNAGISGNTSKDGVVRVLQIAAMHPAVVIVAFGGNDGLRGIPILDTEMNLATVISTLQDAHANVILGGITLPPNYGKDYIAKFNAMYSKQAKLYSVPLLPFILKGAYGVPGDIQSDGIHATGKGNQQVAKNFLPLLLPILHKSPQHPANRAQP